MTMVEVFHEDDATFRNMIWRPSRRVMAAAWLVFLALWLLVLLRSAETGQLSGLLLPAILAVFGVVLVEVGYAASVVLLGTLYGPVELKVERTGLNLRYDTPTGQSERLIPWEAIQRAEWASLEGGEVRIAFRTSTRGARLFQVDSRGVLPETLRHFLEPGTLVEVDLGAPA